MHITDLSAAELSESIHRRDVSCREVMTAYLDRIDERNPALNAIISRRDRDELLVESAACDDELVHGGSRGWMHGMPQAIKDLMPAKGIRMSMGSRLLGNFVPMFDSLMVERMKAAGCIVIGKTNVPEFGLGSHTFNDVFGTTFNPFDLTRTAGGSSGGAAVALATHMLPVADGSDYMPQQAGDDRPRRRTAGARPGCRCPRPPSCRRIRPDRPASAAALRAPTLSVSSPTTSRP